ncbi:MAG: aldo/keto reductase, partial [Paludibacter sp.]|nr:aldo/keto reductase [Paludibacter sp.]
GDHRAFNRNGEAFDKGETFSGIDYLKGLEAVEEIKNLFPKDVELYAVALKWILMFPEVSCIIPGASRPEQIVSNIGASRLDNLSVQMAAIKQIYENKIWPEIAKEKW